MADNAEVVSHNSKAARSSSAAGTAVGSNVATRGASTQARMVAACSRESVPPYATAPAPHAAFAAAHGAAKGQLSFLSICRMSGHHAGDCVFGIANHRIKSQGFPSDHLDFCHLLALCERGDLGGVTHSGRADVFGKLASSVLTGQVERIRKYHGKRVSDFAAVSASGGLGRPRPALYLRRRR